LAFGRRLQLETLLALVVVLALAACGGGSKHKAGACASVTPPAGKARTERKPATQLDQAKTYDVLIKTNCGDFTIRLAVATSPATTASFASLVRKGYFDGTVFHRIVPGFVIQGGDPTGSGTGGPGYSTVDIPPAATRYTRGVVAMAKTGAEPPGTSGSQFFVVTAQDAQLPPEYAVLGKVVRGQAVVDTVGRLGDPASGGQGTPTETVEIEKATLAVH
jgi:cyclophilin family peptidyl-prolyl cis-trans isomerase